MYFTDQQKCILRDFKCTSILSTGKYLCVESLSLWQNLNIILEPVDSPFLKHWYLKVPFYIKEYILHIIPVFRHIWTLVISKYWYLKVNFLISENLLWDISSWTLTSWAQFFKTKDIVN